MAALHGGSMSHAKGIAQVFHPLLAVEFCLRRGVADALERVEQGTVGAFGKESAEDFGLVEIALAETRGMQRHGDDGVERLRADAFVVERLGHPIAERMAQVVVAVVFEAVDELADDSAAQVGRDRTVEMERAVSAVGAGELALDRTVEGLRALPAKWCDDFARFLRAGGAEMHAGGRINGPAEPDLRDKFSWR